MALLIAGVEAVAVAIRDLVHRTTGLFGAGSTSYGDSRRRALDPSRRATVHAGLAARRRAGGAILAVFHDVPDAPGLVDRGLTMREGRLAA